jgi:predicted ester cyclase
MQVGDHLGDQLGESHVVDVSACAADAGSPLRSEYPVNTDQSRDLVLKVYDLLNQGEPERIGELVTPHYLEHDPLPGQGTGREGVVDRFSMITGALAPHFTVHDVIAEGDKVGVRWTNAGTHVGEFAGIPATGHSFEIAGIDVYRVCGGSICEHWHVIDQLAMLTQLRILPAPATS